MRATGNCGQRNLDFPSATGWFTLLVFYSNQKIRSSGFRLDHRPIKVNEASDTLYLLSGAVLFVNVTELMASKLAGPNQRAEMRGSFICPFLG